MRRLLFAVEGQSLRKEGDFAGIVAGSRDYLTCHFGVTASDWLRAKKVAVFDDKYPVAVDEACECRVPNEVTDQKSFKLRLIGQTGSVRITTNAVLIEQVK